MGERAESRLAVLREPARLRGPEAGLTVLGSAGAAGKATAATARNDDLVSPRMGDVAALCRRLWMGMFQFGLGAVVVLMRPLESLSTTSRLLWAIFAVLACGRSACVCTCCACRDGRGAADWRGFPGCSGLSVPPQRAKPTPGGRRSSFISLFRRWSWSRGRARWRAQ